jgi:hypothetical protein
MLRNDPQEEFGRFPGCCGLNAIGPLAIGYLPEILRPGNWRVGPRSEPPDYCSTLDTGRSSDGSGGMTYFLV